MRVLSEIQEEQPLVGEVRGKGLMVGVEMVRDPAKTPAQKEAAIVKAEMLRRGYLIGLGGIHRNVLRLQPPLVITEQEVEASAAALGKSIAAARGQGQG